MKIADKKMTKNINHIKKTIDLLNQHPKVSPGAFFEEKVMNKLYQKEKQYALDRFVNILLRPAFIGLVIVITLINISVLTINYNAQNTTASTESNYNYYELLSFDDIVIEENNKR